MRVTRYLAKLGIVAALTACSESPEASISGAITCIREQVPEGRIVSIEKAEMVLARCQTALDDWSRHSVAGTTGRAFSPSDPAMLAAFHEHQAAAHRLWMTALSHDYAVAHPRYD